MKRMDIDKQNTDWSEETKQCLTQLSLLFSAYSELCETSCVPGGSIMYARLCDMIMQISCDGPEKLELMLDDVCRRNTSFRHAKRDMYQK